MQEYSSALSQALAIASKRDGTKEKLAVKKKKGELLQETAAANILVLVLLIQLSS